MARNTGPRLIAVDLRQQLLFGTFEHALNLLLDHILDRICFDARFRNDATGANLQTLSKLNVESL